jgi:chorismate mutase
MIAEKSNNQVPFLIAGPCSAETENQVFKTAQQLKNVGISYFRAGSWKPRTRPNSFEGNGESALKWLQRVKNELGLKTATEVASAEHAALAIEHQIDLVWIGARTTVNPFTVQEIADALKGTNINVLVKNPVNPELGLWIGAIERFQKVGIKNVGAIHRGFSSFDKNQYRNNPYWQIPLELKRLMPNTQLICDPSHIAGKREYLFEIAQKAMNLDYDGLMIETHTNPDEAWSDKEQQITPSVLADFLQQLEIRKSNSDNVIFNNKLEILRDKIDNLDRELITILAERLKIVNEIGEFKKDNNVSVFQLERWQEIINTRPEWAKILDLDTESVKKLFALIHDESIKIQTEIFNKQHNA